jgi:arylsulfatase A-like enzyme
VARPDRPGTVLNEIVSHNDWFVTLLSAAGEPDIAEKLLAGHDLGREELPGPPRRLRPAPVPDRRASMSPRGDFFYVSDDGDLVALRFDNWKFVFIEQRATGTLRVWARALVVLRVPSCSTCVPTPSNARTSPRTPTTTG